MSITPRQHRPRILRNTCTLGALLAAGVVTGAVFAESKLFDLHLAALAGLRTRVSPGAGQTNGALVGAAPVELRGHHPQARPFDRTRSYAPHHGGHTNL